MDLSRRAFSAGALGTVLGTAAPSALRAAAPANLAAAVAAIAAHAENHRRHFELPALTLGVTAPGGFETVQHFGFANRDARTPVTADTLFQIGSISKAMTVLLLHQFAAEGRLDLNADFARLMPDLPLPKGAGITVQHVIDHVAGLPGNAPMFAEGGLWSAYRPGSHWHYSNTGYDMLGKLAEHVGGKPLGRLLGERIFTPLGMTRSRGAIVAADRMLYAQGYEAHDLTAPFVLGTGVAPAAWVDVTFGAGSVASTAADMNRFLRALADLAQGRGGLGLSPEQCRAYTGHFVATDTPGMRYGNGLMRVVDASRTYLHHTGGMVSFSSAFHLDVASGVGAFASSTVSYAHNYRPRLLTLFAAKAITAAREGRALPPAPPLAQPVKDAAAYAGAYQGLDGAFQVGNAGGLTISADGRTAPLQELGGDLFGTAHPRFRHFSLQFVRRSGRVVGANWGASTFARDGAVQTVAASDPRLARLAGRYVNDSPWVGSLFVVERGGRLWLGTEGVMAPIGNNLWRVGEESWSPERASFANFIDGRPQTFILSGEKYLRHDI